MPTAALLRLEIEGALAHRFPAALTPVPRTICEVAHTGIAQVDALLEGGLPVGAISELTGTVSSGRTSLALAFLACRTAEGRVCAWVDVNDAFDPESAAANGVVLRQVLWVRCRNAEEGAKLKARAKPWSLLDQALRATDLLLQAGGFAAIVLDLGATEREHGNRIPVATWFRFRQAADRARSSLVVLGKAAYAQSSAAVVLECSRRQAKTAGGTVLCGFEYAVRRKRDRPAPAEFGARKPPAREWTAHAAWQAEKRA
jgi:recombination protein RecA